MLKNNWPFPLNLPKTNSVPSSPVNDVSTSGNDISNNIVTETGSNKTKYVFMALGAVTTGVLLYLAYVNRKKITNQYN